MITARGVALKSVGAKVRPTSGAAPRSSKNPWPTRPT